MKKLLALLVATFVLCASLTSCSFVGDFIEDIVGDIIEDKADDAIKNYENSFDETNEPSTLNGVDARNVYRNAQEVVLGMSQYHISGEHELSTKIKGTSKSTDTVFESRVSGNSAHVKNTIGGTAIDYYFSNGAAYMCQGRDVLDKETDAELSEFVEEVGSYINVGRPENGDPGNWVDADYLDFSGRGFEEKVDGDYVLRLDMTSEEGKLYFSRNGFNGSIDRVELDLVQTYGADGNLKKYSYDYKITYTSDGTQCTYESEWDVTIHQTASVDEISLPTWLGGGTGNSGNGGGSVGGGGVGGSVNEEEDPDTVDYYNGVKYYKNTTPRVGDMNNDGKVTYFDVWMQIDQEFDEDDWDGNGVVTYNDIVESGKSASVIQSTISQYVDRYNAR